MFDLGFLNAELERAKQGRWSRASALVDTLMLARRKHPGGPNRLDDLCARYAIDNSRRIKHGALLDAEMLAEVYVELIGARQAQLGLVGEPVCVAARARDGSACACGRAAGAPRHRGANAPRIARSSRRSARRRSGTNICGA